MSALFTFLALKKPYTPPVVVAPDPPSSEVVHLGRAYTNIEKEKWQRRWYNVDGEGKYLVTGDVSPNSAGDKEGILQFAEELVSNNIIDRYDGPTSAVVVTNSKPEPIQQGKRILACAFAALITGETKYINATKNAILDQISRSGVDFSNTTRWISGEIYDKNPGFIIAEWICRLCDAYDFTRNYFTTTQQTQFRNWLIPAAEWFATDLNSPFEQFYIGRLDYINGDATSYSMKPSASWLNYAQKDGYIMLTHDGGIKIPSISLYYNNRKLYCALAILNVGLELKKYGSVADQTKANYFIKTAKTFVIELIKYTIPFTQNGVEYCFFGDMERSFRYAFKEQATSYATQMICAINLFADRLARSGDLSVLNFETTAGIMIDGEPALHGKKSIRLLNRTITAMFDQTGGWKASGELLDGYWLEKPWFTTYDAGTAILNRYWKDPIIKAGYMRDRPNSHPYPSSYNADLGETRMGAGKLTAGLLFKYGQMEDEPTIY